MILVDTSVWIDYFAGRDLPHVLRLEAAIATDEDLALCGIVLTEILQGISNDQVYERVRHYLAPLLMLPMNTVTFVLAADIYRRLRAAGTTIRKTNDCIIAATVLEHDCELLHNDRDFDAIARDFPLQVFRVGE